MTGDVENEWPDIHLLWNGACVGSVPPQTILITSSEEHPLNIEPCFVKDTSITMDT